MMRERMSRPSWSVPRKYSELPPASQAGGRRRRATSWSRGSWGASRGAASATAMFKRTMARPMAPARLRTRAETSRLRGDRGATRVGSAGKGVTLRVPDPRIEPAVEQIHEQVRQHEDQRGHEHGRLHQGIVALEDGRHRKPADARPREDGLRDDGAAQQRAQLESDDGDD